jgi:hypothetical protein
MITLFKYTFASATYIGTSTIPHSTLLSDTTTYSQGYLKSSDWDIYSSTTTNQVKYLFTLDDSNAGTVHVFSSDSYSSGKTFTSSDFVISACSTL